MQHHLLNLHLAHRPRPNPNSNRNLDRNPIHNLSVFGRLEVGGGGRAAPPRVSVVFLHV